MYSRTLVLDSAWRPHRFTSCRRAITLLLGGKAELIEAYDEEICAVSFSIKVPAVIRLVKKILGLKTNFVKFSRANVMARDNNSCQYCGAKKVSNDLTFEHVIPRAQGGKTTWENIVMACRSCNIKKGSRTPEQAGMKLLKVPAKPKSAPEILVRIEFGGSIPEILRSYLYWNLSLEQG
jgi:5-methylcytosine-specific restriction endonuclease McrA